MNILIAEDYIPNQNLLKTMMKDWNLSSDLVSNGQEAVEQAKKNIYDLCLMDINMPIMDGFEATKRIREENSFFPILGISGEKYYNECLEIGMDDFLRKPFSPDSLLKMINELTVKSLNIQYNNSKIEIAKEMPVDSEHLKKLRELDKKGLTKLILRDMNHEFIVHKNVQNKIAHDLVGKGLELTEFLDRSQEKPGLCHLYKSNLYITMRCLLPDEFEKLVAEEDKLLQNATEVTSKKLEEDKSEYEK